MSSVTSHPLYSKTVVGLEKTVIRDKIMRLVQYFSRFLSFYLYRKGYPRQTITQLKNLTKNLGLARKALRVGKPLGMIKAVVAELHNKTAEPLIHFTNLGKNGGMALYLLCDSLLWLNAIGARPLNRAELVGRLANRFWLIAILSSLVQASYKFYLADARERALVQEKVKDQAAIAKVEKEKGAAKVQIVWHAVDALIPSTNLGILNLDDGIIGLAGTLTSFLGLKAAWSGF